MHRKNQDYTDTEIIEGLKRDDRLVLAYLYRDYFEYVSNNVVIGEKLDRNDAADIFQDALLIIWNLVKRPDFILIKTFRSYFTGICRKLVSERLKEEYKYQNDKDTNVEQIIIDAYEIYTEVFPGSNGLTADEMKYELFDKHYRLLKSDCRKILGMAFAGIPYDEIALKMGYKKGTFAKNKKYRIKESLMNNIRNDALYKLLKNG